MVEDDGETMVDDDGADNSVDDSREEVDVTKADRTNENDSNDSMIDEDMRSTVDVSNTVEAKGTV
jgi:hypothetical protein